MMSQEEINAVGHWRIHPNSVTILNDLLSKKEQDLDDLKRLYCSYAITEELRENLIFLTAVILERRSVLQKAKDIIVKQLEVQNSIEISESFEGY